LVSRSDFFLALLFGDQEEQIEFPISEEKLINVLADIHFAESASKDYVNLKKDSSIILFYNQVYQIHEIDSIALDSSLVLLKNHPRTAEKIYRQVLERLSVMENEGF